MSDPETPPASPAGIGAGAPDSDSGDPAAIAEAPPEAAAEPPGKGPLSFLSGALTSALLAWLALGLSRRVVAYYGAHPPHYEAAVAQSIATALRTLLVGMCFLATFTFAFVGFGLFLVFLRSLLPAEAGLRP
jgi:hypothetical protein